MGAFLVLHRFSILFFTLILWKQFLVNIEWTHWHLREGPTTFACKSKNADRQDWYILVYVSWMLYFEVSAKAKEWLAGYSASKVVLHIYIIILVSLSIWKVPSSGKACVSKVIFEAFISVLKERWGFWDRNNAPLNFLSMCKNMWYEDLCNLVKEIRGLYNWYLFSKIFLGVII